MWHAPHGGIGTQPVSWAALAYIGLIAGPFGTWCVMQATATLPTVVSSVGFLTTPAISLILANLLLGEPITTDLLAGFGADHRSASASPPGRATAMMLHAIEAGQGDPPLVLLHGLFGSARNFGTVQREFAQPAAHDRPRSAQSWCEPARRRHALRDMAADVLQTLDRLSALPAIAARTFDGRQGRDAGRADAARTRSRG